MGCVVCLALLGSLIFQSTSALPILQRRKGGGRGGSKGGSGLGAGASLSQKQWPILAGIVGGVSTAFFIFYVWYETNRRRKPKALANQNVYIWNATGKSIFDWKIGSKALFQNTRSITSDGDTRPFLTPNPIPGSFPSPRLGKPPHWHYEAPASPEQAVVKDFHW